MTVDDLNLSPYAREQFTEMQAACPWFSLNKHAMVCLSDDSGNIEELVGVGFGRRTATPALEAGWDRKNDEQSVDLLIAGRRASYVLD